MAISNKFLSLTFGLLLLQSCVTMNAPELAPVNIKTLVDDSKATVFVWWATQCPCVARYESRIEALSNAYASKGVKFYVIASNSDDDRGKIEDVAKRRGFSLPILDDQGGRLAATLGAKSTPTVVIVDHNGEVKYRGWMDNERRVGEAGRIAYVENALNDILEGRAVTQASSPIYGCRITKRLR